MELEKISTEKIILLENSNKNNDLFAFVFNVNDNYFLSFKHIKKV